ncbi:TM helix repeat-containing protein [Halovivax asiaticus JCM 14624]|uniref:TM helix repeat-containing protein n=2 Tax=Halovivax asiaticus TaxID=332953 RepID=M0BTK2_9EURY|nr:TM helix repeat-containing protein [Halovivax asiaticus JCM 14624]
MQLVVQQVQVPDYLQDPIADIAVFVPRLLGAVVILLIGWVVGRVVAGAVRRLADGIELDRMVLETPLGRVLGGTERAVSGAFGKLGKWFVYALAILAAANVLAIPMLSEWISTAVSYLPAFIAGLLVITIGFVVADFIGDVIERTRAATETAYTSWFANGARIFLYATALVIGLETMGIDVGILYVFARALAWGLAAAVAIGAGVAFGWGGKDYVAENIDSWMGRTDAITPEESAGGPRSSDRRGPDRETGPGAEDD